MPRSEHPRVYMRLEPEEAKLFKADAYFSGLGDQGVLYAAWLHWRKEFSSNAENLTPQISDSEIDRDEYSAEYSQLRGILESGTDRSKRLVRDVLETLAELSEEHGSRHPNAKERRKLAEEIKRGLAEHEQRTKKPASA